MAQVRSKTESAAGLLILAIQKVWDYRLGTDQAAAVETIMNKAHDLQRAIRGRRVTELLDGQPIHDYLGADWVACHPGVAQAVTDLESQIEEAEQKKKPVGQP